MSGYAEAKERVASEGLTGPAAESLAKDAFRHEIDRGRPDLALRCARELGLPDGYQLRAATYLFLELVNRARFDRAREIAEEHALALGDPAARRALQAAAALPGHDEHLAAIRVLADAVAQSSQEARFKADEAIELIKRAQATRAEDPVVQGRAVVLSEEGSGPRELWLTGDLHGNTRNLERFAQLADLENHPQRILVLQEIVHSRLITADRRDLAFNTILEALRLLCQFPGRVYYLLGNHDLALHLGRPVIKGGHDLNVYLGRGLQGAYRSHAERVLEAYREFIAGMPAAVIAPNGVFMSHSTPQQAFVPRFSRDYLTGKAAEKPLDKLAPITALVNGRDFQEATAAAFADRVEAEVLLVGHTPTRDGVRLGSSRHLIVDSQHGRARYVKFSLAERYASSEELADEVHPLWSEEPEATSESQPLL